MYADSGYKDMQSNVLFSQPNTNFLSLMFKFYYSTVCFHFIHYISEEIKSLRSFGFSLF